MNAELLILGQRHFADDEHRLAVLSAQGHVVHAEVYVAWMPNGNVLRGCGRIEQADGKIWFRTKDKPEPETFFGEGHYESGPYE